MNRRRSDLIHLNINNQDIGFPDLKNGLTEFFADSGVDQGGFAT